MSPDHLLRTLASVPHGNRVLELNCGEGARTVPLVQLGFDVYACDPGASAVEAARRQVAALLGAEAATRVTVASAEALAFPDAYFDWIVASDAFAHAHADDTLRGTLAEMRRVLKDGGWVYLTVPAVPEAGPLAGPHPGYAGDSGLVLTFTPESLGAVMGAAGFAEAQPPVPTSYEGRPFLQAIYRRVDANTPA
jgi:ubiquinone/menaquinone biosynthesis C-methylase UbiE